MGKKDGIYKYYGQAWNRRWPVKDRQLMLWVSHSSSGYFNMSPVTQKKALYAESTKDIWNGTAWILTLGLFERTDKDGVFKRVILPNEGPLQYFHRALTKVTTKFALVWKLDRLLAKRGCAQHSNQQFADELGRDVSWISRYLKELVTEGIVNRYGGNAGRGPKMYYCNPGDEYLNEALLERYGEHEEDDPRHEKFDKPQAQDRVIEKRMDKDPNAGPIISKKWKKGVIPVKK